MSVIARLKEIEMMLARPLLDVQDELDGGLRALAGLRTLLANQTDAETEGLHELVRMIEERFETAEGLVRCLAFNTFGTVQNVKPRL